MKVALCTLVLNEMEWLPKLYEQHKNWPDMVRWVFVESADTMYTQANPDVVSADGLSTDGTTEFLEELANKDSRIIHIKHGFSYNDDPAQGKCESRNQYLRAIEPDAPDFFVVLDADEFYLKQGQINLNHFIPTRTEWGHCFAHREIWYPPYLKAAGKNLFDLEVVGGFWSIPYCRVWKWFANLQYNNHNTPSHSNGLPLDKRLAQYTQYPTSPYFVHMGFASNLENRAAKNRYYEIRGESVDRNRSWYCDSRRAFETWTPNTVLPKSAKVIKYRGEIPEVFLLNDSKVQPCDT